MTMNVHEIVEFIGKLEAGHGWVAYAKAGTLWAFLTLLAWGVKRFILPHLKWLARFSKTNLDDLFVNGIANHLPPFLYFGAFALAVGPLALPPGAARVFRFVSAFWLVWAAVRLADGVLRFIIFRLWLPVQGDDDLKRKLHSLTPFLNVVLWAVGILVLLDNLGFKLSAVLAGLGIGGVAVALASQAVLGDLFSYFAILFDKPFEHGDMIIVGDMAGTVEAIGIKTTRLRSLGGEQLVFSNTDLTGSRVRNLKRMQERRVLCRVGVTYNTSSALLEELPGRIKAIVASVPQARFDRAHFAAFGPSSLDFEIVFFVLSPDYNDFMNVQQTINLAIKSDFEARGIEFAFPTQTVYLAGSPSAVSQKPVAS